MGVSLEELNAVVISCIDEAKASGNDSADEAKKIFNSIALRGNYNHYLKKRKSKNYYVYTHIA